jgi:hypothetical protein
VAAASSVATSTISLVVEYTRGFSRSIKNPAPKEDNSSSDSPPIEPTPSWDIPISQNPVQAAANFPPERIEAVAYKIASKAFPGPGQGNQKKVNNPGLVKRSSTMRSNELKRSSGEHGRAYNAAHETEHFAASMVATGLRGSHPCYPIK